MHVKVKVQKLPNRLEKEHLSHALASEEECSEGTGLEQALFIYSF